MSEEQIQTPLDAVLQPQAPATSDVQKSGIPDTTGDTQNGGIPPEAHDDEPQVSLLALHRERERRQKMDARVKELEEELQRYHEQRWGLDQQEQQRQTDEATQRKQWEERAFAYNQNFAAFVGKHGKDKVAAIDAAIKGLSPQQRAHVIALASSDGDGVEAVHQYLTQIGSLEDHSFKPISLQDALSGKKAAVQNNTPEQPALPNNLDAREAAIHLAERRTTFNASRAEFVSEFGRKNFEQLDTVSQAFMQSGHPAAQEFAQAVTSASDPVATAAQWLNQHGLWAPEQKTGIPGFSNQQVMPSSFANTRSVASRSGPAFAGPTPLQDIFKR